MLAVMVLAVMSLLRRLPRGRVRATQGIKLLPRAFKRLVLLTGRHFGKKEAARTILRSDCFKRSRQWLILVHEIGAY